jgi:hypothetical protein
MTTRIGAAIAAGFLAIGILVGAAGTIVFRDATGFGPASGRSAMPDVAGMMSMMGTGWWMGPDASMSPSQHASHHTAPSPETTR